MELRKLCVVVPVYKSFNALSEPELASLRQCFTLLSSRSICLVGPDNLDFLPYLELGEYLNVGLTYKKFEPDFFKNIAGYNKLMLSRSFYEAFTDYEYMLIYQTDVWLFKDDLDYWCDKGYDYIGGPWVDWKWSTFVAGHLTLPRTILGKLGYKNFNLVGNGGFSLRKISSFISNLKRFKSAAESFDQNEDFFFSFYINSYNPFFKIPSAKEALKFCFDENPDLCFTNNNRELPMACHAWPRYFSFWKQYIVK